MVDVGSTVTVKEPFSVNFPGVYTVVGRNDAANGWTLDLDGVLSDFDETYLEEVAVSSVP